MVTYRFYLGEELLEEVQVKLGDFKMYLKEFRMDYSEEIADSEFELTWESV